LVFETLPKNPTIHKPEVPIRVIRILEPDVAIDIGTTNESGYAVANVFEWEYGGTTLTSIHFNGKNYQPDVYTNYWFPLPSGQQKVHSLVDGSMRVYSSLGTVFLTPVNTMPFMDSNGTFSYEYKMVSKEVKIPSSPPSPKSETEYSQCNVPVVLFQIGNDYKFMVDRTTNIAYSIENVFVFREMPFSFRESSAIDPWSIYEIDVVGCGE
jgi:hypothetical protein